MISTFLILSLSKLTKMFSRAAINQLERNCAFMHMSSTSLYYDLMTDHKRKGHHSKPIQREQNHIGNIL